MNINRKNFDSLLLATVNNSISSRQMHLTEDDLAALFHKEPQSLNQVERYAVSIIFSEASLQAIHNFMLKHNIPREDAGRLYRLQCEIDPDRRNREDKYEWFFRQIP